jgi:hypothetical protein
VAQNYAFEKKAKSEMEKEKKNVAAHQNSRQIGTPLFLSIINSYP